MITYGIIWLIKNNSNSDCGQPDLLHGSVEVGDTAFKSSGNVTCDEGYSLIGQNIVTCQGDGTWSFNVSCQIAGMTEF